MLKILYAGSPAPAATTLKLLLDKNVSQDQKARDWQITGVLTNPPSAKGRRKELTPTAVGALAQERGLQVFCPQKLDAEAREQIAAAGFDALVCFAYGKIFGPKFLSLFKAGGVNVHPSLLPKYRGATPVPAAILNCDEQTGVTVQTLALGMDEGEILAQQVIALDGTETTDSLLETSAQIAAELLDGLLTKAASEDGALALQKGRPQEGEPSYTKTIAKEDALIDWSAPANKIAAAIRAYTSEPGAWTRIGGETGETLKILKAVALDDEALLGQPNNPGTVAAFDKKRGILIKCGQGILCVTELQRQQKNAMGYKDFMNGARDFVGTQLK